MHHVFLVYFISLCMCRVYLGPSSWGTTICIQQLVLVILFRWLLSWLEWSSNPTRTTDSHLKRVISTNCGIHTVVESSWNVMAHGDAREGRWRGNWRMECVASTIHTTSEHDISSITTTNAYNSAASSRLNWLPQRFKWTRPFRRKTKSGFCSCAITFQTQSTNFQVGLKEEKKIIRQVQWDKFQNQAFLSFTFRTISHVCSFARRISKTTKLIKYQLIAKPRVHRFFQNFRIQQKILGARGVGWVGVKWVKFHNVRFADRRNLVSARVPPHFNRPLQP